MDLISIYVEFSETPKQMQVVSTELETYSPDLFDRQATLCTTSAVNEDLLTYLKAQDAAMEIDRRDIMAVDQRT
jgi:hypothetical protein